MSEAQHKINFEQGEIIFKTGDAPECAFLIQTGAVDIALESGGSLTVVDSLEPGEFFGEMALIDSEPRSAAAIATVPTTCVRVLRPDFEERLKNSDPLTRAMLKLLVKRLRKTTRNRGIS